MFRVESPKLLERLNAVEIGHGVLAVMTVSLSGGPHLRAIPTRAPRGR